jgi:hypothetical protein
MNKVFDIRKDLMETRIAGIPCTVRIDYVCVTPPDPRGDSDWDYYGYTEFDYTVCDRRGRPAPWLTKKMTRADTARIHDEYFA